MIACDIYDRLQILLDVLTGWGFLATILTVAYLWKTRQ